MTLKNFKFFLAGMLLCGATVIATDFAGNRAGAEEPTPLAKNVPSWCLEITADADGGTHNFLGCAETKKLCEIGQKMAKDYASVVGITYVGDCQK